MGPLMGVLLGVGWWDEAGGAGWSEAGVVVAL